MATLASDCWNPSVSHPRPCSAFSSLVSSSLLPLSFPFLSAFIWSALHQREKNIQGSQFCHSWKGEMKQGSLIRPINRWPWVAKGVRVLTCGSPVSPEQLLWLPLFWKILVFIIFTVPFRPQPSLHLSSPYFFSFFFCLHWFFTLVRVRETKLWAGLGTLWTRGVVVMLPKDLADRREKSALSSLLPSQAWEQNPASELKPNSGLLTRPVVTAV